MNLKALTSKELESVLEAIDGIHDAYDLLEAAQVLTDNIDTADLANTIIEEIIARNEAAPAEMIDLLAQGNINPFLRPDGQIGFAPPGAWDGQGYGEGML